MIKALQRWWFAIGLKWHKQRSLFELERDIRYIEAFKGEMLRYDESKARKRMAELKAKETRTDVEEQELDHVLAVIAESKAVKQAHAKSVQVAEDVRNYLTML